MKEKPTIINYLLPLVMIILGSIHFVRHGLDLVAIIPVLLGVFALYLAVFNHSLLQKVLLVITKLWYPVGQFITVILLTVTFLLVFAPVGLILRLLRKDILNRKSQANALSYWVDRPKRELNNYTQQF